MSVHFVPGTVLSLRDPAGSPPGTVSALMGLMLWGGGRGRQLGTDHERVMTVSGECRGGNGEQVVEANRGAAAGGLEIDWFRWPF